MNYRHGDLSLTAIEKMPSMASVKRQSQIHGGSHGNPHSIVGGAFYPNPEGENVLGYLRVSKGGYLTHAEHGEVVEGDSLRRAPLEPGIYEVRVQVEDGNEGMKVVVD